MGGINTEIEIKASPDVVRAKFLDFVQLPKYHQSFIKSVTSKSTAATKHIPGKDFAAGDTIVAFMEGPGEIEPTVIENSPQAFIWRLAIPGIFTGDHFFRFKPSTSAPSVMIFEHGEYFSGTMSFLLGTNWLARKLGFRKDMEGKFEAFNRDLKAWCEKSD